MTRFVPFAEPAVAKRLDVNCEPGNIVPAATDSQVCVRLDLEDLPCFSPVDRQYEAWGVQFKNAVAISPSNPAYPSHSGTMVMMGAPENGWLEATFVQPVRHVTSFITSSRRTVMRAFNRQNQLVAEMESPDANLDTPRSEPDRSGSTHAPANLRLSVSATEIYRITFHSYHGHLTVDDFCFCG
jgi:hypothetical protein